MRLNHRYYHPLHHASISSASLTKASEREGAATPTIIKSLSLLCYFNDRMGVQRTTPTRACRSIMGEKWGNAATSYTCRGTGFWGILPVRTAPATHGKNHEPREQQPNAHLHLTTHPGARGHNTSLSFPLG